VSAAARSSNAGDGAGEAGGDAGSDVDTSAFRARSPRRDAFAPLRREPWLAYGGRLSPSAIVLLGAGAWLAFAGLWQLAVTLELAPPVLLVGPLDVLASLWHKLDSAHFARDIGVSLARILVSFAAASAIAFPCGVLMGAFPLFAALINPIVAAFRYLPAPSFVPLLLMTLGPGDLQKMSLLFVGVVFFLITLVTDNTRTVAVELVETAATLGASRLQTLLRVIIPASLPGAVIAHRQMLAVSWTYLVVAEIVAADEGIGAVMVRSQRVLDTAAILACILTIGVLGLLSDQAFGALAWLMFPHLRSARTGRQKSDS
jgi:NitT/TauT family transport system permease protein